MSEPITIIIQGEPIAKGRPRMTRKGFAYTPAATRKYEAHGRLAAQLAMNGNPPLAGPVKIELLVELPIPASWSQRKSTAALTGDVRPTSKPDIDNYVKAALDALNSIVVCDDSQVVELQSVKRFGSSPKMVATVFPLAAVGSNQRGRP